MQNAEYLMHILHYGRQLLRHVAESNDIRRRNQPGGRRLDDDLTVARLDVEVRALVPALADRQFDRFVDDPLQKRAPNAML